MPAFDLHMAFEPTDFIQINADINRSLIANVLELLDLSAADQVLDLFCGLGNFTLPMARRAASVVGVEGDAQLVARAARNAAENGIGNVEFIAANLSLVPLAASFMRRPYTKLLLDPPRTGALEIIQQLDYRTMRRIVYVSCNPATLARDARVLTEEKGYVLSAAGVLDMFPHTAHVESIALFDCP
jgi:23S rRNA (uracil1939-C5)-methyltransferase